jgi:hypothetical protein
VDLKNRGVGVVGVVGLVLACAAIVIVAGCADDKAAPPAAIDAAKTAPAEPAPPPTPSRGQSPERCADYDANRQPFFGDTHVHTRLSFDAAANTTGATPVDANRFAKGEAIPFWPIGADGTPEGQYKIDRPLDFLAVSDHGELLGERRLCREPDSPTYDSEFCKATRVSERQGMVMMAEVISTDHPRRLPQICGEDGELCREFAKEPWQFMIDAANNANDACEFTSYIAYEYTGTPETSNYHRNVIFRGSKVPELPVSYIDAPFDSELWKQLDAVCKREEGCDYLTIPHNSNLANGRMQPYRRIEATMENRRAYAEKRMDREPIIEMFQHKGGSECINGLSTVLGPPDELCNVEAVRVMGREETYITREGAGTEMKMGETSEVTGECAEGAIGAQGMLGAGCVDETDFVRSGLLIGLKEEQETGLNPMKLGMIAATDTHTATPGAVDERDWRGAVSGEATPQERLEPGLLTSGIDGNPGGLAGVWAEENTRDAIFDAMKRREVWGTSGPRIVPRFFAGWSYPEDLCDSASLVEVGYRDGVPMGSDLSSAPDGGAPVFVASVARDSSDLGAPLQQLQLIKGWIDAEGRMHSSVVTIAGTPDNGAGVDPATGARTGTGHDSLCTVYRDDDFDPSVPSYYYLRAVENPSARWTVFDCLRIPEAERPAVCSDGTYPSTLQEMAWTSPIWYRPN